MGIGNGQDARVGQQFAQTHEIGPANERVKSAIESAVIRLEAAVVRANEALLHLDSALAPVTSDTKTAGHEPSERVAHRCGTSPLAGVIFDAAERIESMESFIHNLVGRLEV